MIRIAFAFAALLALLPTLPSAQTLTAPPVDEAQTNEGFLAYREKLLKAVVARDVDTILSLADEDIHLSFGGSAGHAAFREFLEVDPETFAPEFRHEAPAMRERNWTDLETVLRMGGVFNSEGQFIAPYTFAIDPPAEWDTFEVMIVTGSGVALRKRPIKYAEVVGRLDYDVVRHLHWVSGTNYVEIARADGSTGFVHRGYLRSLVDYRAIFRKTDSGWKMGTFIAGD